MKSIKTVMAALFGAGLAILTIYAIETDNNKNYLLSGFIVESI